MFFWDGLRSKEGLVKIKVGNLIVPFDVFLTQELQKDYNVLAKLLGYAISVMDSGVTLAFKSL